MLAHPILINRPIVVTAKGTKLCRPSETVLDLLDRPVTSFVKEDGEHIRPKLGRAFARHDRAAYSLPWNLTPASD